MAVSVDNELVLFSGTTGEIVKRSSGTGVVTVANGVAAVAASDSTLVGLGNVPNVNATLRGNHTGTQPADTITDGTTNKAYTAVEKSKLATVATNATANATDASLRDRSTHSGTQLAATVSDFASSADARITLQKAAVNGLATLGADGKIPSGQVPAIAINETFVVASQTAMLALAAQVGDVAVRTDLNKSFILQTAPPATLTNWQELLSSGSGTVSSVNGQTGTVVLTKTDVSLSLVPNVDATDRGSHTGTQLAVTVSDFGESVDDRVAALLVMGAGMTKAYDDAANTLTLSASGGATGTSSPEVIHLTDFIPNWQAKLVSRIIGTTTGGTTTTLTDTAKAWSVNAYTGFKVLVRTGGGAGSLRTVLSNTATTLTISGTFTAAPIAGATYDLFYDATTEFQSAVNATQSGGTLVLPTGSIFTIGLNITTNGKPIRIEGQGQNATYWRVQGHPASTAHAMIRSEYSVQRNKTVVPGAHIQGFELRDMTLDGGWETGYRPGTPSSGMVWLSGVDHVKITDCRFVNVPGDAITIYDCRWGRVANCWSDNLFYGFIRFEDLRDQVNGGVTRGRYDRDWIIEDNYCSNLCMVGGIRGIGFVAAHGGINAHGWMKIRGNTIYNSRYISLALDWLVHSEIAHNSIFYDTASAQAGEAIALSGCYNKVHHNEVWGCASGAILLYAVGGANGANNVPGINAADCTNDYNEYADNVAYGSRIGYAVHFDGTSGQTTTCRGFVFRDNRAFASVVAQPGQFSQAIAFQFRKTTGVLIATSNWLFTGNHSAGSDFGIDFNNGAGDFPYAEREAIVTTMAFGPQTMMLRGYTNAAPSVNSNTIDNPNDMQWAPRATWQYPMRWGPFYIWIDATGDWRQKTGAPTSDTDVASVVIGTQT